jgi:hypothetical protein
MSRPADLIQGTLVLLILKTVPRAPSAGAARVDPRRMARQRDRSRSQVLRAHRCRPRPTRKRTSAMGAPVKRRGSGDSKRSGSVAMRRWLDLAACGSGRFRDGVLSNRAASLTLRRNAAICAASTGSKTAGPIFATLSARCAKAPALRQSSFKSWRSILSVIHGVLLRRLPPRLPRRREGIIG